MERLNLHLAEELSKQFDVHLIGPKGASQYFATPAAVTEITLRPLVRFLLGAALKAIFKAHSWRPQIIIAGSGLTAPIAFLAAKICGAKSYAYVHGLDLATEQIAYRLFWRPVLRNMDGVIANSRATAQIGYGIGIREHRMAIVHPGVSIPEIIDRSVDERFREKYGLRRGSILLSVGRLTVRKGLREFVQGVLPLIVVQKPDVQLVVIGEEPADSLYAEGQSIASIMEVAAAVGVEKNIRFLGKKFADELAEAFLSAAVHVFPVRYIAGDPEGFGMVAIEAAAYGVPTVAYATGGVIDAVAHNQSGLLVKPGESVEFAEAVLQLLSNPMDTTQVRHFAVKFAWSAFGKKLISAISEN